MINDINVKFDIDTARLAVKDFSLSTGISCMLLDAEGNKLFAEHLENVCSLLAQAIGQDFKCAKLHGHSAANAMRFGGRYIYDCPMGFAFFSAPIMDGGALTGALVAGPVQIMDAEDQLSGSKFNVYEADEKVICDAENALSYAPKRNHEQLKALSRQLFAVAVYISDSTNALIHAKIDSDNSSAVNNYIDYLKRSEGDRVPYPIDKERELFNTVMRGDREMAATLMNQILGHIYFYAVDNEEIYIRIQELLVVLMRAVACSGADIEHVMDLSRRYQGELRTLRTQEQLTIWLATSLQNFMNQLISVADVRHSTAITKSIEYIKQKYALNPTLDEVAGYAGYSPAYFSRIFKEDTGMTFSEFLNDIRIEKSKTLLITTNLSIADISSMLGYNDQSYFCRIFKSITGTTPDRFRKRSRRINYDKEYEG